VVENSYGSVFTTGDTLLLKKYLLPETRCSKIDTRTKMPKKPLEDVEGHDLPTTCMDLLANKKLLATGS